MDILIVPMLLLLKAILEMAVIVVLADVVLGWLLHANVLNGSNRFICAVIGVISALSNLMLNQIRRNIPTTFGMFDISPVVLILLLTFLENVLVRILVRVA
jgi:YggT family protein